MINMEEIKEKTDSLSTIKIEPLAVGEVNTPAGTDMTAVPELGTKEQLDALVKREIAYTIKDVNFGKFDVYNSANAWWMDATKVNDLITSFKNGSNIGIACAYIGISKRQWEYFNEVHPEFCEVKEACLAFFDGIALKTTGDAIKKSGKLAMAWLDKRGFFEPTEKKPAMGEAGNITNIQINHVQVGKIEERVATILARVLTGRKTGGEKVSDGGVEADNQGGL